VNGAYIKKRGGKEEKNQGKKKKQTARSPRKKGRVASLELRGGKNLKKQMTI